MDYVSERVRGETTLSIATSLAFESLLGTHPENDKNHPPDTIKQYDVLWVNIKTLYRNIYHAIDRERLNYTSDEQLSNALFAELDVIRGICKNDFQNIPVVFFMPNYLGIDKINKEVLLRLDNTSLQKTFTQRMRNSFGSVLKWHNENTSLDDQNRIRIYKNEINEYDSRKVLMLTHYAYDITNYRRFKQMSLLESHTGAIKNRELWYTKYYNGNNLPEMPFRLDFLTIMGDATLFRCKAPALKKALVELAEKFNWTATTSITSIREDIGTIKNHEIRFRLLNVLDR